MDIQGRSGHAYQTEQPPSKSNYPFIHPMPYQASYSNPMVAGSSHPSASGPSYQPPRPRTPPPPPRNIGYIPTFLPRRDHSGENYVNMSSSVAAPGRGGARPGFALGAAAGALVAGAVIFGDDFMSGFQAPAGFQDASLTITTDPPF
ncbi:Calcium-dependent lipid-binding family protein [Tripterygium wilfordii]|uniref:Calcium-dependent lipid-binding family protein n=2 Tax=Tripterygium wilfordii TaxID=458696 RepID=A0A7J7E280_TRIWF|nr:Calcium-dependent lipid-binding family protein [Tripterygium wilfordii]